MEQSEIRPEVVPPSQISKRVDKPITLMSAQSCECPSAQLEQLARTLEQSPSLVLMTDLQGAIVYVNRRFTEITGYTPDEVLGENPRLLRSGETAPAEYRQMWESVAAGGTWQGIIQNRRKNGDFYWQACQVYPIRDTAGCITNYVCTGEDISVGKEMREQFRQFQTMEAVGRLASGTAHDFNNLLTVIEGYAQIALERVHGDGQLRRDLEEILRATGRASHLTNDLLLFSRRHLAESKAFDLNVLLSETLQTLGEMFDERYRLRLDLSRNPMAVCGAPEHIRQIVKNALLFFRQAAPEGGLTDISTRPAGAHYELAIGHSGLVLDPECLSHLFEPFLTVREHVSTGLLLASIYGMVAQAGGQIRAISEAGQGTVFHISLPPSEDEIETGYPELPGGQPGGETILVVDDEDGVRGLVSEILEADGYTVLTAAGGSEALELLECHSGPVHLLLTDVVMPRMRGPELAREVLRRRPELPVLYMSGYSENSIGQDELGQPGAGFLQKPFTPQLLIRRVRALLDLRPKPSAASVLVVDDETPVRQVIRHMLEPAGYQVLEAPDGRRAMDELGNRSVDLLITDLVMPEREGLDIIQAARRRYPGLKIIAISGAFGGKFLKPAALLGAHATMSKPLDCRALLQTVGEVLRA